MAEREDLVYSISVEGDKEAIAKLEKIEKALTKVQNDASKKPSSAEIVDIKSLKEQFKEIKNIPLSSLEVAQKKISALMSLKNQTNKTNDNLKQIKSFKNDINSLIGSLLNFKPNSASTSVPKPVAKALTDTYSLAIPPKSNDTSKQQNLAITKPTDTSKWLENGVKNLTQLDELIKRFSNATEVVKETKDITANMGLAIKGLIEFNKNYKTAQPDILVTPIPSDPPKQDKTREQKFEGNKVEEQKKIEFEPPKPPQEVKPLLKPLKPNDASQTPLLKDIPSVFNSKDVIEGAKLVNVVKKLKNGVEEVVETWQKINSDGTVITFTKVGNQITKVGDNITKVGSKTRKVTSGFDKFKQKFKGVFFYRVIRGMIQALEQAIQHLIQFAMEGVKIFAKFDKATKKAYSTITSSFTMLKGSLGSLFAPITEAIAPAINSIAKSFADFTNSIRQAKAQMQGLSKYTKINTDYYKEFKELQNQGQFKFDTFNTLSNAPEESGLFEQASVNEDIDVGQIEYLKNTILGFSDSLGGLWEIIQGVANSFMPLIRPIIDLVLIAVSVIMDALSITFETLKPILDTVFGAIEEIWIELQPFVLYLGEMFTKAFEVVGAIIDQIWIMIEPVIIWIKDACKIVANLLSGDIAGAFSSLGDLVMNIFIGIANFLIGTINLVSTFINYAIEGVMKAVGNIVNPIMEFVDKTSKFFGGDGVSWRMDTEGWKIPMIQKIEYKADGGTVSAGTMFIAGESGTEMVWNNSSGGSSVANIEQIRQAQYESMMQAIYDSGLLVTIENSGVHDIYMDSEKVGNSIGKTKSLRTQLNRTNLGLGLK